MRSVAFLVAPVLLAGLAAGCSALLDFDSRRTSAADADGSTPLPGDEDAAIDGSDSGGVMSDAEAGADVVDGALPCPGKAGPTPVRVVTPVSTYCIDSTEVTNTQYNAFLADNVAVGTQVFPCTGNTTFVPMGGQPPSNLKPVVHVDWCDAVAFCKWADKRLCGKIGGGSAAIGVKAESQWYQACSMLDTRAYPYGAAFSSTACVTGAGSQNAGGTPTCTGGFPGIFDMSGNVGEWEDACNGSDCPVRGGAFDTAGASSLRCDYAKTELRDATEHEEVGFRCCSP